MSTQERLTQDITYIRSVFAGIIPPDNNKPKASPSGDFFSLHPLIYDGVSQNWTFVASDTSTSTLTSTYF